MLKSFRFLGLIVAISFVLIAAEFYPHLVALLDSTPPTIDVWYGPRQVFGRSGIPQRWINILGNIHDPESRIGAVSYRLNGEPPVEMVLGPDFRRLERPGDFNIDLDPASLQPGENLLEIEATNGRGQGMTQQVIIDFQPTPRALPFHIRWAEVKDIQEVAQLVDGRWQWDASGVRTQELGYDRMIAIGDQNWTDYQVTVPVTVHGVNPRAWQHRQGGKHAGVSIDMRWIGHSDDPVVCQQPKCGWNPAGNFNKYFFRKNGEDYLGLKVTEHEKGYATLPYKFQIEHTYVFKVAVETTARGNEYHMKVWEPSAEPEPAGWMFTSLDPTGQGNDGNPARGAFSLVAHHSDVTFGDILVEEFP